MKNGNTKHKKKLLSAYEAAWLVAILACNFGVYIGARALTGGRRHYDLSLAIDDRIPFLPWMIVIYLGCYLFWGVSYIWIVSCGREVAKRFALSEMAGKLVCFVCYLALPTTMARPTAEGDGIWMLLVRTMYGIDAPDNLFPSIHCYVSWMCYLGARDKERIPVWYRYFSLLMSVLVFLSTLTVKQHVILDVLAGVLLAEVVYRLGNRNK